MDDPQEHKGPDVASNYDTEAYHHQELQADSTPIRVQLALGNDPREPGTPVTNQEFSLPKLADLLTNHESRAEKIGPYFCAPMRGSRRNGENAQPWRLLALDFDGKDGPKPDMDRSRAWFSSVWHVGYSTHSYSTDNGKHRVVLLLSREIDKGEHRRLFDALAEALPYEPDAKLNHPDQPVFLPACPPGTAPVAWCNQGQPFDVDTALAAYSARREVESRARQTYRQPQQGSVIQAFNDAHDLASILEANRYRRVGKKYLHPHSESGIPSVSLLAEGRLCFSHSSSDPLGDGQAHDAFDAWAILEHNGDKKAATKAAAERLGLGRERRQFHPEGQQDERPGIDLLDADGKRKSQATLLIEIGSQFDLFHDADRNGFAVVPRGHAVECWPIRSQGFRHILAGEFYALTGKGFNRNSAADAMDTLEAKAVHTGRLQPVYLRVARTEQAIYLDLCDDDWRVIEITADGWAILPRSPVAFVRKPGMASLPVPVRPGRLEHLADLINLDREAGHFELVVGWMLGALRGQSPYPILVLQGEQGTGKSSASRIIRRFVDPSTVPLRAPPKDPRDLIVSATNNHLVCLDNLSGITPDISDCLCRFATGGGLDVRKLYTDSDSVLIDIQRPALVNGIDDICSRPDLAQRAVVVHLPVLEAPTCVTECVLSKRVRETEAYIMAGLLDALAAALRNEAITHLPNPPRMADFAVWATAAEEALPWPAGGFMQAYRAMQGRAIEEGIEASPVGSVLVEYLRSLAPITRWAPTPTNLFETLTREAGSRASSPAWPKTPRGLGNALNRIAPNLRAIGITYSKRHDHDREYTFIVQSPKEAPNAPNAPEAAPHKGFSVGASRAHLGGWAHRSAQAPTEKTEAPTDIPSQINDLGVSGGLGASFPYCTTLEGDRI